MRGHGSYPNARSLSTMQGLRRRLPARVSKDFSGFDIKGPDGKNLASGTHSDGATKRMGLEVAEIEMPKQWG